MSTSGWFYVQDDKRQGPVDVQHIVHLVVTAVLSPAALVWHHGLAEWTEAERVPQIAALLPPPLPHGKPEPAVEPPPLPARSRADKPAETAPPPPPASPKIEELRHRLEKEPNPRLFAQLAEELRKVGDHAEAIRVCREGVERSPAYPSLRLTLGRALLESGDLPAARAELEAVLQAAPDNIVAERSLGECLEAMGDRAGARARYLKALALAPGDAQLVARLRSLHAGDVPMPPPGAAPAPAPPPPLAATATAPLPRRSRAASATEAPPPPVEAPAPPPPPADSDPLAGILDDSQSTGNGGAPSLSHAAEPPPAPAPKELPPIPLVPVNEAFEIERAGDVGAAAEGPSARRSGASTSGRKPSPRDDERRHAGGAGESVLLDDPAPSAPPPLPTRVRPSTAKDAPILSALAPPKPADGAPAGMFLEPERPIAWPTGRLADHEFADLVREVYSRHWTGLLTLNHMGVEKSVRVKEGRLVFAFSSSRDDRLGELLLRRGRITLHQYVAAGRAMGKGMRLGTVLVQQGALDPRELVKVVMDHTQEIIYSAFQWTEGTYHFTEGGEATEPITLRLSTPDVILEGIRRIESWSRIEHAVGGMDTRYLRAPGYEKVLGEMTLSLEKLSILTGLEVVQAVDSICSNSTLSHFEVCRTLWAYRVIGVVQRLRSGDLQV